MLILKHMLNHSFALEASIFRFRRMPHLQKFSRIWTTSISYSGCDPHTNFQTPSQESLAKQNPLGTAAAV
jgi:hypothetical protein